MITLAMLVKDPPLDRLAMLLDYVAPVVGQVVIVVDDRTSEADREVMRGLGAVVVPFMWIDDFAAARNAALPHALGDWILHLDPDELPSRDMLAFLAMVDCSEWQPSVEWWGVTHVDPRGYLFWTRGYVSGTRDQELEQDWHCRLFRRTAGVWYKPVHEQVMLEGMPESRTRGTPLLPKAPMAAFLIHSRMEDRARDEQYAALSGAVP